LVHPNPVVRSVLHVKQDGSLIRQRRQRACFT